MVQPHDWAVPGGPGLRTSGTAGTRGRWPVQALHSEGSGGSKAKRRGRTLTSVTFTILVFCLDKAPSATTVDAAAVAAVFGDVTRACDACHATYREGDPQTGYRIRSAVSSGTPK